MSHHRDASASVSHPWRLRPTYHLTPPTNWLNDPCGLAHDPSTGLYHLAYQWNPHANNWGNISWGHAVSRDLLSWTTSPRPVLEPSCEYDAGGVFTGCLRPAGVFGEGEEDGGCLTAVYTAVSRLPIHYSLPYVRGCESVGLAVSRDGGASWRKVEGGNPVVAGPPGNVDVTGWRDPFITSWPALQDSQGQGQGQGQGRLYGFISGGISQTSPTVFVYTVNPRDLREWQYLGPLVDVGLNHRPGRWSGDLGVNWEVATLVSVDDSRGVSRDFVITGAEGCIPPPNSPSRRVPRAQLWIAVKVNSQSQLRFSEQDSRSSSSNSSGCNTNTPLANYAFSGIFDHGNFYAANSFFDPLAQRHVIYGWITEDDLPDTLRHEQGWSGLISLPRTVELVTLRRVTRARRSELRSITSLEVESEDDTTGTYTIRTLGIKPDPRVEKLRAPARYVELAETRLDAGAGAEGVSLPLTNSRWEVDAAFAVGRSCTGVGIVVEHGETQHTTLTWTPSTETFQITRPDPAGIDSAINHDPETAPHTLFTYATHAGEHSQEEEEEEEPLRIRAFFDASVLEVFVNERTVLSTRVYSSCWGCVGVRFFAGNGPGSPGDSGEPGCGGVLQYARVWDGLQLR